MSLTISNEKIINFYKSHNNLNFENMNLLLIELLEKVFDNISSDMNKTITSQILSSINEYMSLLKNQNVENNSKFSGIIQELESLKSIQNLSSNNIQNSISHINEKISTINNDITNSVVSKFLDFKKDHINDIKLLLNESSSGYSDKVDNLLGKCNNHFIDKLTILFNEQFPKQNSFIDNIINTFKNDISKDSSNICELIKNNTIDEKTIQNFFTTYDEKCNTLINNNIHTCVNSMEERLNNQLLNISQHNTSNESYMKNINTIIHDYFDKYKNSNKKGQLGEQKLESILNHSYPSAVVQNTTSIKHSCDFIMSREGEPIVMFENKDYETSVPVDEVKKFVRDVNEQKHHAIFLSHKSGISGKQNFQIDIKNGYILIYIHYVNYESHLIQCAVQMIDMLSDHVSEENNNIKNNENIIDNDILNNINTEFQAFMENRSIMISTLKDYNRKMTSHIDSLYLPSLEKYLSSKYMNTVKKACLMCVCGKTFKNERAIRTHKNTCTGIKEEIVINT